MQLIDQKIKDIQGEINLWTSLLYPHLINLSELDTGEFSTYLLGPDGEESEVSAEFAFESFVAAYGRLQEIVQAAEHLWPHLKEHLDIEIPLEQSLPHEILGFLKEKSSSEESRLWAANLIFKRTEHFHDVLTQDIELDLKDLFSIIARWRRSLAKTKALELPIVEFEELLSGGDHRCRGMIDEKVSFLENKDRKVLRNAIRSYLTSEYIFPWISDENTNSRRYDSLFQLAHLKIEKMYENIEGTIHELFEDGVIQEDAIQEASQILTRITSVLNQIGSYGTLIDQILQNGGQWGPDSFVGSRGPVNIIPATDQRGTCQDVLLAFAQGRRSPKRGLRPVLRKVREHLIHCNQTYLVIIFTDTWDPEIFAESVGDFEAHRLAGMPKTIIGALINGKRLTVQPIN